MNEKKTGADTMLRFFYRKAKKYSRMSNCYFLEKQSIIERSTENE